MKKTFTLMIIGLIFITTFSITLHSTSLGDDGPNDGCIYGYTYQTSGWQSYPAPFVHIEIEGKHCISDLYGYYEINELPLDQDLDVNAHKFGYEDVCISIELTFDDPEREVDLQLVLKDTSQTVHNPLYHFL